MFGTMDVSICYVSAVCLGQWMCPFVRCQLCVPKGVTNVRRFYNASSLFSLEQRKAGVNCQVYNSDLVCTSVEGCLGSIIHGVEHFVLKCGPEQSTVKAILNRVIHSNPDNSTALVQLQYITARRLYSEISVKVRRHDSCK